MKQLTHWQDAVNAVMGVWLVASPWVLGFSGLENALMAAVASGIVIALLVLWTQDYNPWRREPAAR